MSKQSKIIFWSCFAVLIIGSIFFGDSVVADQGVLWHIKAGEWMVQHRAIPHFDPFLSWGSNLFWLSDQWLADIILYLLIHIGGLPLLGIFTEIILAITFFCIPFILSQKVTDNPLISAIVAFICAINASISWFCRPFIFGILLFNITYLIAWTNYGQQKPKRNIYFLPLIFGLWANLHPSFLLGLFVCGIFLLCSLDYKNIIAGIKAKQEYFAVGIFSLIATLINPYGYKLHVHALGVAGSGYITSMFTEWLAVNFQNPSLIPFGLTLLLIIFGLHLAKKVTFSAPEIICFLVFLVESLIHVRYILFFMITLVVPLTKLLTEVVAKIQFRQASSGNDRAVRGLLIFLFIIFICLAILVPNKKFRYPKDYPMDAVEHIASLNMKEAKLFNNMNWGGIVTYFLYPEYKSFLDDRASMIGKEMYTKYSAFYDMSKNWDKLFEEFEFDIMMLDPKVPATTFLRMNNDWEISYEDKQAVVFVKKKD